MHVEENKGEKYNNINICWKEQEKKSFVTDLMCACTKLDVGKNDCGLIKKIDCQENIKRAEQNQGVC